MTVKEIPKLAEQAKETKLTDLENKKELYNAETTMLFLIKNEKGIFNFLFDTSDCSIFTQDENSRFSLHKEIKYKGIEVGQLCELAIDYTNDPSPSHAGSVVSLGYHVLRIHVGSFEKKRPARIVNLKPFTVECLKKDVDMHFTRPQRLRYISKEREIYNAILPAIKQDLKEVIAKEIVRVLPKVKELKK